ncbi:MAG: hypothetical protein NO126_02770 [Sulfolobales archaeon]|nr:hypothetical protein [Sulfolobales archaeon]
MELAKKAKELGSQYEEVYNAILNELFNLIPYCQALHFEDSLLPVYAVSALKTKGLLAFPYKCKGLVGYVIITEDGKLLFEDVEGDVYNL